MTNPIAGQIPLVSDVVVERESHLGRERTLKAIAALMGLSGVTGLLGGLVTLLLTATGRMELPPKDLLGFLYGQALSAALVWGGSRLWRLDRGGLIAIVIWAASLTFSAVWMISSLGSTPLAEGAEDAASAANAIFVGVIIFMSLLAIYLWWLAFARKSRRVVSQEFQKEVIQLTPRISNRLATSTVVCLLVLAAFNLVSVIGPAWTLFRQAD